MRDRRARERARDVLEIFVEAARVARPRGLSRFVARDAYDARKSYAREVVLDTRLARKRVRHVHDSRRALVASTHVPVVACALCRAECVSASALYGHRAACLRRGSTSPRARAPRAR